MPLKEKIVLNSGRKCCVLYSRQIKNFWKDGDFVSKYIKSQKAHTRLCELNSDNDVVWNYHHTVWAKQYNEKRVLSRSERTQIYNDSKKFGVGGVHKLYKKYVFPNEPKWFK